MPVGYNLILLGFIAIYCVIAAAQCLLVMGHAQRAIGIPRLGWVFISSLGVGGTIWVTQFVTQIALLTHAPIAFDGERVFLAGAVAMTGSFLVITLFAWAQSPFQRAVCGVLLSLVIASAHFVGLSALLIEATTHWNQTVFMLATAICMGLMMFSGGLAVPQSTVLFRPAAPIALMGASLFAMQIIGHAALSVSAIADSAAMAAHHAHPSVSLMIYALIGTGCLLMISGFAMHMIDVSLREESDAQLRHMALHDQLTGLPNRTSFRKDLGQELTGERAENFVAVIGIDLNRFKEINDTWGHSAGDSVLCEIATRLSTVGKGTISARFGGDEFAILGRFDSEIELQSFAEGLQRALVQPIRLDIGEVNVGASLGIAIHPRDGHDADTLIRNADLAMYRAKIDPVSSVHVYDAHLGEQVRVQHTMITDLRNAIENDELDLHYQVQLDVETYEIVGYEALLRWTHPKLGAISPSVFIPLAESNGLITKLGDWVLERACRDAAAWSNPVKVAVNLSAVQLAMDDLTSRIHELLFETGLKPERLEIELTETALMRDQTKGLRLMRQIKNLGVGFALDNFGAGHASLDILRSFPFSTVKLDKTFIQSMTRDGRTRAVAESLKMLAQSLSIRVMAEGVEDAEQMTLIRAVGFDQVQGFLMGKPNVLDADSMQQPGVDLETEWRENPTTA